MSTHPPRESHGMFERIKRQLEHEFLAIERNSTLTEDQKVSRLIKTTATICAAVAAQPIPFADMPILTAIQGIMGYKISQVRGVPVTKEGIAEILKYIGGVVGLGFAAQQTAIGLYKLGLPGLGGLMTIPLVFGLTYGIGRAIDVYFVYKRQGKRPPDEVILAAFKAGKRESRAAARTRLPAVIGGEDRGRGS